MSNSIDSDDEIAAYEKINTKFLKTIFNLEPSQFKVSDLTVLSDFSTKVMTDNMELSNFDDYYSKAEKKILKLVNDNYKVNLEKGINTKLVDIYKSLAGK